jgi:hypothetical protein
MVATNAPSRAPSIAAFDEFFQLQYLSGNLIRDVRPRPGSTLMRSVHRDGVHNADNVQLAGLLKEQALSRVFLAQSSVMRMMLYGRSPFDSAAGGGPDRRGPSRGSPGTDTRDS